MAITAQYRITVRCDVCHKVETVESIGSPIPNPVPAAWIQTAPPGMTTNKEFCSTECLLEWKSDVKPWKEEE